MHQLDVIGGYSQIKQIKAAWEGFFCSVNFLIFIHSQRRVKNCITWLYKWANLCMYMLNYVTSFLKPQMNFASLALNSHLGLGPSQSAFSISWTLQSALVCCCGETMYSRVRTLRPLPEKVIQWKSIYCP